jgi:hypothetical protein
MTTTPWPVGQAIGKLFEGMPEHVLKIFEQNKQNVRGFVWLGMMNKTMYHAIWGNLELIMAMMRARHEYYHAVVSYDYNMLDARYDVLAQMRHIPPALRFEFTKYAQRFLHMEYMTWCGLCRRYNRDVRPEWQLGTCLCLNCRHANFITEGRLTREYGVSLSTRFDGQLFAALITCKVYVRVIPQYERSYLLRYTCDSQDLAPLPDSKQVKIKDTYVLLWLPHLARVLDLKGLKALQDTKHQAMRLLGGCVHRLLVRIELWTLAKGPLTTFMPQQPIRLLSPATNIVEFQVAMQRRVFFKDYVPRNNKRKKMLMAEKELRMKTIDDMRIAPFLACQFP